MQVSLNDLVQLLADRVGSPFSIPLQEQLKVIFNYKIADWVQKLIDKHPEQRKFFMKYIADELVDVDQSECPAAVGCTIRRTSKKIPVPVRSEYALFDYVGDPDKLDGYTYTTPDQLTIMINHGSKYTKDRPRYMYMNGYVYIYNDNILEYLSIGGLWTDQRQLNAFKCEDVPCYTDDDQLDVAADIINTMVQDVMKNELRLLSPEAGEITVDDKEK